ncbi:alkaline phosphatase family protein [Novosphingobium tardum]|uniref:Alkaline phosphatase n=1 Tax=Novosphingobium tardum TaxID=1538021 RepID=A0ABV8RLT1_9SPHN
MRVRARLLTFLALSAFPLGLAGCATAPAQSVSPPLAAAPIPAAEPAAVPSGPPRLIVAISVDQFSADLFAQYRSRYTEGLRRLQQGAVFPAGYQSHAATETCPGHSTILTGDHPARTGIIANNWFDLGAARDKKSIYCAEDETKAASDPKDYVASVGHLLVPTLGDRMKAADPRTRSVAVAGKDRAALMMGGRTLDQVYWWKGSGFATLEGRTLGPSALAENEAVAAQLAVPAAAMPLPGDCTAMDRPIQAGKVTVGTGRFARGAGEANQFRISPALDAATVDLAKKVIAEMDLGTGAATDIIAVGLSATDYIGHATGTEGTEMCIQMHALDHAVGDLLSFLESRGIDYQVVLTADHGGFDVPERLDIQGLPHAARAVPALVPEALGKAIAERLKIAVKGPLILGDAPFGDLYFNRALTARQKTQVFGELKREALAQPQVAAVFSAAEIAATPPPTGSPETWTLIQRARASYYAPRSGDAVMLLKRAIVPIPVPAPGYTATHGSPWDYDRRVPMLFFRPGMTGFEQPNAVETVDIAPTLAALIGLSSEPGAFDGRCLDLDPGAATTCAR